MSESYVLYHYDSCPYCARVRRFLETRHIDIGLRDILKDPAARQELIAGGGRSTVPCLKITDGDGHVRWMYESIDIIEYLKQRLAAA